jgi:hypothetical protein
MKKITFLMFLILCLSMSCKKEPDPPLISFDPTISAPDKITWDSVSYTTIRYSYQHELKDDEYNNPDIYSHSGNLDLRTEYLALEANQVIVIKKFNMIGKSGQVLYYIPFSGEPSATGASLKLPWQLNTGEGKSSYSIPVIRYLEGD